MKLSRDLDAFQDRIGHRFGQPELLLRAMTHSSIASDTRPDNQRLEFLGDRVLGLVIAEVARSVGLGDVLKLGKSEQVTGGRRKLALLGDAMEALIAAVYLDAGLDAARAMILRLWSDQVENVEYDARDAKTTLQEWAQARGMKPPVYTVTERSGPDHAPVFRITASLGDGPSADGEAPSKRAAEQAAAKALLTEVSHD